MKKLICKDHYPAEKNSQHTPGPWKVTTYVPGPSYQLGKDCKSVLEMEANKNLIAAAPELLEACKTALTFCKDISDDEVVDELKAAIAKAQGD